MKIQPLFALVFGLSIGMIYPCSNNLYLKSNGKICEKNVCKDISMASFPIERGKIICFHNTDNEILKIEATRIYHILKYNHIYDTSEFVIKISKIAACGNLFGNSCADNDQLCEKNVKHKNFVEVPNKVQDYTCQTASSCSGFCPSDITCTYTHWWLDPIGTKAKVYKFTSKMWQVDLFIEYKGMKDTVTLNSYEPSYEIDSADFLAIKKLPIFITSIIDQDCYISKNLIQDNLKFFQIEAAELNFPSTDLVGDYQIDIRGNGTPTYKASDVTCQADYCNPTCDTPPSTLKRFRSTKQAKNDLTSNAIINKREVHIKKRTQASFNMMIGSIDIDHLYINKAICNIRLRRMQPKAVYHI